MEYDISEVHLTTQHLMGKWRGWCSRLSKLLKQGKVEEGLSHRLANFLLTYGTTPHSTTGKSPSQLFLQRDIRTHFDLLKPDCEKEVLKRLRKVLMTNELREENGS